ncbi:CDP-alcohol phosphatidyltransferase family protein [Candidatus Woesearchaeota archaeon]|nr:MAG: CDP-alcohol phosphatidyltransferase family protein [Candidatus Woesearchaeota archaeon]
MLGQYLRKKTKRILLSLGRSVNKTGIPPNAITLSAIVLSIISSFFITKQENVLALMFVILTGLCDLLDGAMARAGKKATKFGNYLDAMVDRIAEIIIYLGFALLGYGVEAFLAISTSMLVTYGKARVAQVVQISNEEWPAVGERIDRFILLILSLVVISIYQEEIVYRVSLIIISTVAFIGSVQRMIYAKRLIEKAGFK